LNDHRQAIAMNLAELGNTNMGEIKINLTQREPVVLKPYRIPFGQRSYIDETINELLEAGNQHQHIVVLLSWCQKNQVN
jgi:hypothetical protein